MVFKMGTRDQLKPLNGRGSSSFQDFGTKLGPANPASHLAP